MLANQLFWRIFAACAVLGTISVLVFTGLQSAAHRQKLEDQRQENLRNQALLLRDLWNAGRLSSPAGNAQSSEPFQIFAAEVAAQMQDSDVQHAWTTGEGFSDPKTSRSQSTYAVRVGPEDAPQGVIRVRSPAPVISGNQFLFDFRWVTAAVALAGLGLLITQRLVSHLLSPLDALTLAARQIATGQIPQEIPERTRRELGDLALAFESMSRQLAGRIADLQDQRKRLQHNNEQLETVMGAMVEGVIAVDAGERVLLANSAAFHLLEMSPATMVGRPIWEAVREPRIDELIRQALRGEPTERLEFEVLRAQYTVSVAASQLPGDPCPGAVLVLHDVTELRRLERLRREFVANVSHELKTPLTSIAAYTETLLDGAVDDPDINRQFLKRIEEQADRLQALIADLLSIARMETDDSAYELVSVDIAEIITASLDAHQGVADAKRIELCAAGAIEPDSLWADPEGMRTVLDNLLDNAINYTASGGRVTVRWFPEGEWLQVDVIDTGVGIAKEHQTRIFERFFRVDKARSREVGGTGLGLSIVKHFCQMFGGTVSVSSQFGRGSTFSVRLKRAFSTAIL